MSKRDTKLLLQDISEAAEKILSYTEGMSFDDFVNDQKTIDAVVRNFEVIGEVTKRIPDDFKFTYPEIEWHKIAALRNRIIHEYFGINYKTVWKIKEKNIPTLLEFVKRHINKSEKE